MLRYQPHRRHDLESFVRTLMFYLLGLRLPYDELKNINKSDKDYVQQRALIMMRFWRGVDFYHNSDHWKKALEISRAKAPSKGQNQLEELKQHFNDNFNGLIRQISINFY